MFCSKGSRMPQVLAFGLTMMAVSGASAVEKSSAMLTGGLTSQPIGHYEFCKANAAECSIKLRDPGRLHVTDPVWKEIDGVNTLVNTSVKAMSDYDHYGKDEVWAYPDDGYGDCEDYVLEKRRKLSHLGISLSDLLITVVRKPDGEGHAVLTVRT